MYRPITYIFLKIKNQKIGNRRTILRKSKIAFLLILISFFFSCVVYRETPIEVLRPKIIDIPDKTSLTLIYRNFKYENDTLQNYIRDNYTLKYDSRSKKVNIDSLVSMSILNTLASQPELRQNTSTPHVFIYNTFPRMTGLKLSPLSQELVQNIAKSSGAQKVISLETLTYMYSWYSYISGSDESSDVAIDGTWAVYDGLTGILLQQEQVVDTLYWTTNLNPHSQARTLVPPWITAMKLAAETYAENFAKKFTTAWETVQRLIIVPPVKEFTLATEYASENKWEEALELWQRYTPDRFGRLSVSARFNVALAYEMMDNLDKAIEWIELALVQTRIYRNKEELRLIQNYQQILDQRKKEINQLQNATNK
jgi:hypothetical protein